MLLTPVVAHAQSVSIDLGAAGQAGATGRLVQLTALVTVLSIAPSLLVMMTAFHPDRDRAVPAAKRAEHAGQREGSKSAANELRRLRFSQS